MLDESRQCGECGSPLPLDADACPVCLLRLGLHAPAMAISELAELFPQLEILDLLGEGGMGVVYRARQRKLERVVALKLLSPELSADPAFAERFRREAQALARLQHPNIVSLYDFGEAGGTYFLVMEYAEGLNLRQILLRGGLKPAEALAIVPQICDGLQYAHESGVIHRDIKPENVLVDRSGRVKITDFGLAKIVDRPGPSISLTGTGQLMGTPHYMAPEQLANARDVDHRADIYSLGVVFYELLTGSLPRGRFDLPSRRIAVDVRLDEVVLRALEQEPDLRYQQARELKTDVAIATGPPAAEEKKEAEAAPDASLLRAALRSLGWFTAAWLTAGLAFRWGPLALALAGNAWLAIALAEGRRRFLPVSASVGRRALGTVAASVLLAASFALFFVSEVSRWERSSWGYVSSPQEPKELLRVGEHDLKELLGPASVAVRERSDVTDVPKIYRARFVWIAAALCLGLAMVALAAASGPLPPPGRLALPLASAWAPPILALLMLNGAIAVARRLDPPAPLVPLVSTAEVEGEVSAVADRLYLAMLETGSAVDTRHVWSVTAPGAARPAFGMQLLSGQPGSPFDRWTMTWTGARRTFPHLVLTLAGPVAGGRTAVKIDAGRARAGEDAARWRQLANDLLARASR